MNIKVGIDLVEVKRFESQPNRFFEKLFTKNEIEYCSSHHFPHQHFAGHFAVKEAVMKALGIGLDTVPFKDIEVCHTKEKSPFVVLSGKAKNLFQEKGFSVAEISISHTETFATAICIMS